MKKILALLFGLAATCGTARAATLTIPNVFTPGGQITSAGFNQNFSAITVWSTTIDNTNIGTLGIYASQIIPTSGTQATFGGSQAYTFPPGIKTPTVTLNNYNLPYDPRGDSHWETGTIPDLPANGTYNVYFQFPFTTTPTWCDHPESFSGSTPSNTIYIYAFLGSAGNYTGMTLRNGFTVAVNAPYACKGT